MENDNRHIVLKTNDLEIGYTSKKSIKTITKDVNITLEKGAFICLLGQNGIGKSTLLRTLTKVQPQINGDVFINDENLNSISQNELSKKISLVLTERLPESNLTVLEIIALGRQPYTNWIGKLTEVDIKKIESAITSTNIKHLKHLKHYELSDGQLQKVLIARALAQDTDIIILDEPTAHLDVQHTMETFQLLKNLTEIHHKTILISTHEINLAIETSDKLLLMTEKGLFTGKPLDLIENGDIKNLFTSNTIEFNNSKKRFVLKN